ncbi:MAG: hypothetical protein HW380_3456 [Magnetococcales bacterium]|nr:hypothetical protein [Magnetococcales bacterium]
MCGLLAQNGLGFVWLRFRLPASVVLRVNPTDMIRNIVYVSKKRSLAKIIAGVQMGGMIPPGGGLGVNYPRFLSFHE